MNDTEIKVTEIQEFMTPEVRSAIIDEMKKVLKKFDLEIDRKIILSSEIEEKTRGTAADYRPKKRVTCNLLYNFKEKDQTEKVKAGYFEFDQNTGKVKLQLPEYILEITDLQDGIVYSNKEVENMLSAYLNQKIPLEFLKKYGFEYADKSLEYSNQLSAVSLKQDFHPYALLSCSITFKLGIAVMEHYRLLEQTPGPVSNLEYVCGENRNTQKLLEANID